MKILHLLSWLLATSLQLQTAVSLPGYTDLNHFRRAAAADSGICTVDGKAVFAHFMVGNVPFWGVSQWTRDMTRAKQAHIDGFVLNMASTDQNLLTQVAYAFSAAKKVGFKCLFSFDETSNWSYDAIMGYLNQYIGNDAYYIYKGKPLVSTFEGAGNADAWRQIKAQTGIVFIPDWSSLGAQAAVKLGVADGLFSWAGWPWGNTDMNTYVDASYHQFLNGMPYMMPVSPWFYTNLPQFNKNWLWRGDDLWYDRWEEVMFWQPDLVEIISWNDWGESHYVGPIDETTMGAMRSAPFNYALGMPHDAWLLFLPYIIETYKTGYSSIGQEGVQAWYRPNPNSAGCGTNGTTGNTASQLLIEFPPSKVVQDKIFYSALLSSEADVFVTIGGVDTGAKWLKKPYSGVGIYHGSVDIKGTGPVIIVISRGGTVICSAIGDVHISNDCQLGLANYNAYVMGATGDSSPALPDASICNLNCTSGSGAGDFQKLCAYSCAIGYCPKGACYCTGMGKAKLPKVSGPVGYPIAGADANYEGLCNFACVYGYCPPEHCGTVSGLPMATPTVSPFTPPACVLGSGAGLLEGLCSFACNFGFCPINACTCTAQGPLNVPPKASPDIVGIPAAGLDHATFGPLCQFACWHGWCPSDVCTKLQDGSGPVYIDPAIFTAQDPEVDCNPPCTFVFPPTTYHGETVFSFPPVKTTLVLGKGNDATVLTTVITPKPSTGSTVGFFDLTVSGSSDFSFSMTTMFKPSPVIITVNMISIVYTTQLWFNPVTSPSNWQIGGNASATTTTTSNGVVFFPPVEWPSLSETTYCSGIICQTFSIDQLTSLTNDPSPTTAVISIPVPKTSGQTTSPIIVVTVPVQSYGFYWRPKPNPVDPKIPFPTFPPLPFPEVPKLPCLNFGLIKINCPPNKNNPTTRFSNGPPKPTCTQHCGTICTVNCDTDGQPSSESETETECETQTVTDIFVSCQTGSCTTTKTSLASGCTVLATTTTTQAPWCPTGVPGEQEEDTDNLDNAPVVYGKEIAGMPQNGVVIVGGVGGERHPIYYAATSPSGWYWWYPASSRSVELPPEMLSPGTVTSAVYYSFLPAFPTVRIIPPIIGATRLAPTGNYLEKRNFVTNHDCGKCSGDICRVRAAGLGFPPCCADLSCGPVWPICNCRPDGACAGTDPDCCFIDGGLSCDGLVN
ncbi:hypothetical protein BGAL_0041g00240 [Botrytis galanthina]|uniref:Uncharacterized protein n=1 Tax=Botrytis galanthina TaxID=278940 RepID=A0A4S8R7E2_9HELO|nr:hypothetical protein BGAL_0041g00240 [Botrytis galanthina]